MLNSSINAMLVCPAVTCTVNVDSTAVVVSAFWKLSEPDSEVFCTRTGTVAWVCARTLVPSYTTAVNS